MLKLTVMGCTGKMGQLLLKEINQTPEAEVAGAVTRPENPFIGQDIGNLIGEAPLNIFITDVPMAPMRDADVVIDFSHPDALKTHLTQAISLQKPYVVCITGLNDAQKNQLEHASHSIPLLIAPNTSLGVALLRKLATLAAELLGPSYDVSILEMHHRHKADSPSGTSLLLAQTLAKAAHLKESAPPYPSLSPRPDHSIECATLRGGGVPGDHSVIFAGEKDMITLEHRTLHRTLFAEGAIKAAQWLYGKSAGLYTIDDVVRI